MLSRQTKVADDGQIKVDIFSVNDYATSASNHYGINRKIDQKLRAGRNTPQVKQQIVKWPARSFIYLARRLIILAALVNTSLAFAQERVPAREDNGVSEREIVVIGQRTGEVFFDVRPIDEIDESEIGAFASGTIAELLGALSPQTRGSSRAGPVVLVNGKRIGSVSEVSSLPPEALVKIQIFPEQLAQSLGASADQRVVNLVLKKDFRAITNQILAKLPTAGAGNEYQGSFDLARIEGSRRWNVSARYSRREAIFESDRTVIGGRGDRQTLLPKSDRIKFSGAWSDYVSDDVQLDVNASVDAGQSTGRVANRSKQALGDPPFHLTRRKSRGASFAVSGNGQLGSWDWFTSGSMDWSYSANRIDRRTALAANQFSRTEGRTTNFRGNALLNGTVANVPAGPISASVELSILKEITSGNSNLDGMVTHSKIARTSSGTKATLAIPLTSSSFFGSIGRLTANFEGGVETVSNISSLTDYGFGLRWAPHPSVQMSAFWSRNEDAPSASDLSDPQTLTPDVTIFDFVRGESTVVDFLEGGNPNLNPETSKSFRLSLSIRPEDWSDFSFNASFVRRRLDNAVTSISVISPELADAFPDRFIRGKDGRLERFDVRPLNIGRSRRESANWTISWSKQLKDQKVSEAAALEKESEKNQKLSSGVLIFSLDHRVRLRDQQELLLNSQPVDLLKGATGGSSKHNLEFSARAIYRGLGMNLNANWASGYKARFGSQALNYSTLARFDIKLFANINEVIRQNERTRWTKGLRAELAVENLFNSRRRIVDQNGDTPLAFQPSYLDPLGRTIQFSIRKLF
ncbi:TonB-dependent receptor plug domain-containing protein [Parasphingorhabdus sp.]|uniref:TonB-dependent receptor plug domain-containing protein n=1 Tax=Parasphingorhabdus sp. TaxID=2709688 RepID=UPI0035936934